MGKECWQKPYTWTHFGKRHDYGEERQCANYFKIDLPMLLQNLSTLSWKALGHKCVGWQSCHSSCIVRSWYLVRNPSTSFFLRVHVLSLLNYQINWGRSTHFCLQYPLTPQCDLRQYAMSYPQVVGVIQKQSGIHLCKHYYRYRYSAHTALMSWSTWLVQRQTWRQTLLSQNLKTEP